jgi:hypothetical protein
MQKWLLLLLFFVISYCGSNNRGPISAALVTKIQHVNVQCLNSRFSLPITRFIARSPNSRNAHIGKAQIPPTSIVEWIRHRLPIPSSINHRIQQLHRHHVNFFNIISRVSKFQFFNGRFFRMTFKMQRPNSSSSSSFIRLRK